MGLAAHQVAISQEVIPLEPMRPAVCEYPKELQTAAVEHARTGRLAHAPLVQLTPAGAWSKR